MSKQNLDQYKTDLKDAKTFKWGILKRRKNLFLSTRACRHAQVFIRERYFVMACYDVDYEWCTRSSVVSARRNGFPLFAARTLIV